MNWYVLRIAFVLLFACCLALAASTASAHHPYRGGYGAGFYGGGYGGYGNYGAGFVPSPGYAPYGYGGGYGHGGYGYGGGYGPMFGRGFSFSSYGPYGGSTLYFGFGGGCGCR